MAPLRFGLIGTGYWALHVHGTGLLASDHAVLEGVWGRDPAKAQDIGRRLGSKGYRDLDSLLDDVDAVAVAVPPDVQAELAVRAARAGCHLLLDKPLALTVEAALELVQAVDEAGVASVMFFTSRFRPDVEQWLVSAAEAGPWHSAHLVHYGNIFQPGNPFGNSPWRREYGALWDIGPHGLASLLPIMGPVTSVAARGGPTESDTVHLVLSHGAHLEAPEPAASITTAGGEESYLAAPSSEEAAAGTRRRAAMELDQLPIAPTSASTMSLSLTVPPAATTSQLVLYGEHGVCLRPEGNFEAVDAFTLAVQELAEMVACGEQRHRCDVHFGLEVVRVLAAAEEALGLPGIELGD
ncbi:MAG TPA: Gfo/Idh/MocA family oxidoreductase [Acidimicrobiales bacterium]|nr:Gfo/Idh/MocA family oxidoreductase [Acidimicrobiales bacterium]